MNKKLIIILVSVLAIAIILLGVVVFIKATAKPKNYDLCIQSGQYDMRLCEISNMEIGCYEDAYGETLSCYE